MKLSDDDTFLLFLAAIFGDIFSIVGLVRAFVLNDSVFAVMAIFLLMNSLAFTIIGVKAGIEQNRRDGFGRVKKNDTYTNPV
jgi:hypothetical protein